MPQFDPTYFAPQLVWLAITFLALYLLMSRLILPRITGILSQREDRIEGNLKRAETLKEEAAQVLRGDPAAGVRDLDPRTAHPVLGPTLRRPIHRLCPHRECAPIVHGLARIVEGIDDDDSC